MSTDCLLHGYIYPVSSTSEHQKIRGLVMVAMIPAVPTWTPGYIFLQMFLVSGGGHSTRKRLTSIIRVGIIPPLRRVYLSTGLRTRQRQNVLCCANSPH